jgi:hypothetical protein
MVVLLVRLTTELKRYVLVEREEARVWAWQRQLTAPLRQQRQKQRYRGSVQN